MERFVQKHNVEQVVQATCLSLHVVCRFIAELTQEMIKAVLVAKPHNPRKFLLNYLEKDQSQLQV